MKLHDLRPAEGSRKERTRVGRGIAAGKGKTAGRGTKGQKARAGGSIPPWFEGGQTPLHVRIPKLRGFKNRFKIEFEVVNVGAIAAAVERGAFEVEAGDAKPKGKAKSAPAQITINQDILRAVGLVRSLNKPLKILGNGESRRGTLRRGRRVHRVGALEDRGGRRHGQRPRGPDAARSRRSVSTRTARRPRRPRRLTSPTRPRRPRSRRRPPEPPRRQPSPRRPTSRRRPTRRAARPRNGDRGRPGGHRRSRDDVRRRRLTPCSNRC